MPTYRVNKATWVLNSLSSDDIEAENGQEAIRMVEDEEVELTADGATPDRHIREAYIYADLVDDNGAVDCDEVIYRNYNDLITNCFDHFRLLHPKGWMHS